MAAAHGVAAGSEGDASLRQIGDTSGERIAADEQEVEPGTVANDFDLYRLRGKSFAQVRRVVENHSVRDGAGDVHLDYHAVFGGRELDHQSVFALSEKG